MDIAFVVSGPPERIRGQGRYAWPAGSDALLEVERDAVVAEVVAAFAAEAERRSLTEIAGTRRTQRDHRGDDAAERNQSHYQLEVEGTSVVVVADFVAADEPVISGDAPR